MSICRGLVLWAVTCAIAYPIGLFYHAQVSPRLLAFLIVVIGFNAALSGFNSTALYTLNRRLQLGKITILSVSGQIVGTLVTIAIALKYPSAWAIVLGGNAIGIFTLSVSHFIIRGYRNRVRWDRRAFHELFHFGKWIFVSTLFTFFANEIDRPLLARLGTLSTLGVYSLSLTLIRIPIDLISRLSSLTLYPALARSAQGGTARLSESVLKARRLLLSVGVAIMLGLALGAPLFFKLLYTKVWQDAGWIAQFMAIGIWASILQLTADRALLVIGQSRALAFSNAVNFVTTALGCIAGQYAGMHFFGHNWGLQGFILGVASGNFAGHVVIEAALWANGIRIYMQDLMYTLLLIGLTVAGMGLPHLVALGLQGTAARVCEIICPTVLVLTTSCWAAARAWRFVAK
jgi:O-antigen/teichoic acid export membrane protein